MFPSWTDHGETIVQVRIWTQTEFRQKFLLFDSNLEKRKQKTRDVLFFYFSKLIYLLLGDINCIKKVNPSRLELNGAKALDFHALLLYSEPWLELAKWVKWLSRNRAFRWLFIKNNFESRLNECMLDCHTHSALSEIEARRSLVSTS